MCDPITIAGVALSGLSAGLNYAGQAKASNARDDALAAERIRQQGLDQEAQALNLQSQDRYQGFEGQQEERAGELAEYYKGQEAAEPAASDALPQSSSNITVREEEKQKAKAKEYTDETGAALGNLRSFGDLLGGIGREQARDATSIGQIGGFKQGSSGVLGYELDEASRAGQGLGTMADIAGGIGSLGISAGLSGGGLSGLAVETDPWANLRNVTNNTSKSSSGVRLRNDIGLSGIYR